MMDRGYQHNLKEKLQSEINEVRPPETKQQGRKRNVAFRDKIPALITVKEALMEKWNIIQNQPLLC